MTGSTLVAVPAADPPSYDTVGPGLAGFLVIFVLALATIVLIRSMVGHLRKVRYSRDPAAEDTPAEDASAAAADRPSSEGTGSAPSAVAAADVPPVTGGPRRRPPG